MKCPKCQYIGFDSGDRCRNCGYEFSLSVQSFEADLPIQTGLEPVGPLADLSLREVEPSPRDILVPEPAFAAAPPFPEVRETAVARAEPRRGPMTPELPLFKGERSIAHDEPLIAPAASPRPPLAVRRGPPGTTRRQRSAVEEARLDLDPAAPEREPIEPVPSRPPVALLLGQPEAPDQAASPRAAGAGQRALAATLDALLLAVINGAVLYFTLKVCGLQWQEIALLPALPFAGYLLLLDGGYSVAFTAAGGQTIGKMATGIKVIPAQPGETADGRVSIGQAVLRSAAWIASAVAVGLGFLPALFGADRRAMHDWLAATRVVKA
jgi:uncharacterized RDD family membrane protein YckC